MPQEYYIREPDNETARGPFNVEKLTSLAEADQLGLETLYYDEDTEQWYPISSNDELRRQVFPEKKKLALKPKAADEMNLLNAEEEEIEAVSVEDMLAAAEGQSEETKHVKKKQVWAERAAAMAIPAIGFIMLLAAFNNIYPNWRIIPEQVIDEENYLALLQYPMLVVGILDLLFAVFLFLSVTEIYPMLRFRAMLGLGYLGFFHWAQYFAGDQHALYLMITAIAGSLGIYVCTMTLKFSLMLSFAALGLIGMGGYGYLSIFAPELPTEAVEESGTPPAP